MMPEALIKLGLKEALSDFCTELDKGNPLHIIFQFYGQFERLDSNLEINAYRIIQELVNNALKHSMATELVVQMIQESNRLCFMVMDNGVGFDVNHISTLKGVGLSSVRSRVDAFNGQIEINSALGKGTEFTIEFSV
jgi:signal transduction histidine kinase